MENSNWSWNSEKQVYMHVGGAHLIRKISGEFAYELHTNFPSKKSHACMHDNDLMALYILGDQTPVKKD